VSDSFVIHQQEAITLLIPVKKDGVPWADIANASSVIFFLIDTKKEPTQNGATITCADSGSADWASGLVAVPYTAIQTAALSPGTYIGELRVTISGTVRTARCSRLFCVKGSVTPA
jgi:hypothetical protein